MEHSVLLIEDNESIRNSMIYSLEKEGYGVYAFSHAETALECCKIKRLA